MPKYLISKCPKIANDRIIPSFYLDNVDKRWYSFASIIFIVLEEHNKENIDNLQ